MAKKSKKVEETVVEETVVEESQEEIVEEKPSDRAAALKRLMAAYSEKTADIEAAKATLDEAASARGDVVRQIGEAIAPATKFRYQGQEVTVMHRGGSWFFRGAKKADDSLLEID